MLLDCLVWLQCGERKSAAPGVKTGGQNWWPEKKGKGGDSWLIVSLSVKGNGKHQSPSGCARKLILMARNCSGIS